MFLSFFRSILYRIYTQDVKLESEEKKEEEYHPAEFTIGDVVWAQARGLPSWPGKIVDERDVGGVRADNGKVIALDHWISSMETRLDGFLKQIYFRETFTHMSAEYRIFFFLLRSIHHSKNGGGMCILP